MGYEMMVQGSMRSNGSLSNSMYLTLSTTHKIWNEQVSMPMPISFTLRISHRILRFMPFRFPN